MLIAEVEAFGAEPEAGPEATPLKTTGDKNWSILYGRIVGNDNNPVPCMEVSAGLLGAPLSYRSFTRPDGIWLLPIPQPADTAVYLKIDGKDAGVVKTRGDFPGPDGLQTINRTPSFPVGNFLLTAFSFGILGLAGYGAYRLISK